MPKVAKIAVMWTSSGITGKKFFSFVLVTLIPLLIVRDAFVQGILVGSLGCALLLVSTDAIINGFFLRRGRYSIAGKRYEVRDHIYPRRLLESYRSLVSLEDYFTLSWIPLYRNNNSRWLYLESIFWLTKTLLMTDVLILGGGGGSLVNMLYEEKHPRSIDVVEISSEFIHIAKHVFQIDHPQITYICDDAFHFLKQNRKRYNLIIVDVFDGTKIDPRVYNPQYVGYIKKACKKHGAIIVNLGFSESVVDFYAPWTERMKMRAYQDKRNILLSNILKDLSHHGIKTVYQS